MVLTTITLPSEFSLVIGTGVASAFLLGWLGSRVSKQRKALGVELPSLYADAAEARVDKKKHLFNCYQRGHQNALETYPWVLMTLLIGGAKHPLIASAAGWVWIVGRALYAIGYSSGEPKNRSWGFIFHIGELLLIGATVSTALTIGRFI
eukprot:TRINITY_DN8378_c0_g1_i1.p1 TRINITY_DN8378_c0_g1~~TRINITY_DN8378_c0_g1_i1.p1  ORF type:complete len:150 (-),score=16.39 TRINITY_DN8378_c0_g1_i1:99-548(-)